MKEFLNGMHQSMKITLMIIFYSLATLGLVDFLYQVTTGDKFGPIARILTFIFG